jgi:hypothetical protein
VTSHYPKPTERTVVWRMNMTLSMIVVASIALLAPSATASDLVEVQPLTDRIVMLHLNDGYVQHHLRGQPRSEEKVITDPLDIAAASRPERYSILSADDPAYREGKSPITVGRKSKGTDFAWFVDKWENGRAINTRPDHTKEHWLYLGLPTPMQPGKTYTLNTGNLAKNGKEWSLRFDIAKARSEAIHVNTIGYVPAAPQKYAYVYHWMGDKGSSHPTRSLKPRSIGFCKPHFERSISTRKCIVSISRPGRYSRNRDTPSCI